MTRTEIAPLVYKGGHRIERIIVEIFRPWCAECTEPIAAYYLDSIDQAKERLAVHLHTYHGHPISKIEHDE